MGKDRVKEILNKALNRYAINLNSCSNYEQGDKLRTECIEQAEHQIRAYFLELVSVKEIENKIYEYMGDGMYSSDIKAQKIAIEIHKLFKERINHEP